MKQRDQLRANQPDAPKIAQLKKNIKANINAQKPDKWRATVSVSEINRKDNPNKLQLISYKRYLEFTLVQWRLSIYPWGLAVGTFFMKSLVFKLIKHLNGR